MRGTVCWLSLALWSFLGTACTGNAPPPSAAQATSPASPAIATVPSTEAQATTPPTFVTATPDPVAPSGAPRITSLTRGQTIDATTIEVSGELTAALGPGQSVTVLVRPIPEAADQVWHVQQAPTISGAKWRASPVYIGNPGDRGRGYTFRVAVVITGKQFRRGEQLAAPPDGLSHTIDIVRQ